MDGSRQRSGVFGEAVTQYESARPGYPAALVADVLAGAAPGPALEVGAGTGKATVAFAAHGLDLVCVEPDPRMAAALTANCPGVSVRVTPFESFVPDRRFGLLYSAQAWHWVDARRRWDLAAAALAPGGTLALFWNRPTVLDAGLHAALVEVDARHGMVGASPHRDHASTQAGDIEDDLDAEWPTVRLAADPRFTDLRSRRYRGAHSYRTAGYLDLLASISAYRMLSPDQFQAVRAEIAEVIDGHGGVVEQAVVTDLALVRRTSVA